MVVVFGKLIKLYKIDIWFIFKQVQFNNNNKAENDFGFSNLFF
jgi:hypothetical protein